MQTKSIKQKIKSIGNVGKITKTMELVSAAKMKKAIAEALAIRPFYTEAQFILSTISKDPHTDHRYIKDKSGDTEVLVIVASNKGLCGAYHLNLYRSILTNFKNNSNKIKVVCVGKYASKIAVRLGYEVLANFTDKKFDEIDSRVITKIIMEEYDRDNVSKISLVYTHYESATTFAPKCMKLLPYSFEKSVEENKADKFDYEPNQDSVLDVIIPLAIEHQIYGGVKESYASEHSSRMFAMKNATDNAKEIGKVLKQSFNKARQGQVTQEISEIVSGAMSLQDK